MSSADGTTRIVLIHATTVSITPIKIAFEAQWPEAETINLVDDSLSKDLNSGKVDYSKIEARILGLAKYGEGIGAAGILFTCSRDSWVSTSKVRILSTSSPKNSMRYGSS